MRGKVEGTKCVKIDHRITPAYAGKSIELEEKKVETKDHPRLCGEKLEKRFKFKMTLGSPPPMRGKVPHSFVHHLSTRITPAYAGKSVSVLHSDLIQ